MRLGISSPLKHDTPEEWAYNQVKLGCSAERYFHAEEFIDECAGILGDRIRSCHIKDVHLDRRYTLRLEECGPGDGEFPLKYYVEKMSEIDPEMPMILEHLNTDEEYIKYLGYIKKEIV